MSSECLRARTFISCILAKFCSVGRGRVEYGVLNKRWVTEMEQVEQREQAD